MIAGHGYVLMDAEGIGGDDAFFCTRHKLRKKRKRFGSGPSSRRFAGFGKGGIFAVKMAVTSSRRSNFQFENYDHRLKT
jgi:hypothetical protein